MRAFIHDSRPKLCEERALSFAPPYSFSCTAIECENEEKNTCEKEVGNK